jgi:hypothetical protein
MCPQRPALSSRSSAYSWMRYTPHGLVDDGPVAGIGVPASRGSGASVGNVRSLNLTSAIALNPASLQHLVVKGNRFVAARMPRGKCSMASGVFALLCDAWSRAAHCAPGCPPSNPLPTEARFFYLSRPGPAGIGITVYDFRTKPVSDVPGETAKLPSMTVKPALFIDPARTPNGATEPRDTLILSVEAHQRA